MTGAVFNMAVTSPYSSHNFPAPVPRTGCCQSKLQKNAIKIMMLVNAAH